MQASMFGQRRKTRYLTEFKSDIRYYREVIVISYLPPSRAFGIRRDINPDGAIETPIVLVEIVLPTCSRFYRCQRVGILEAIDRTVASQNWVNWVPVFEQICGDLYREVDRDLLHWRI
jgi:hypothetical protein